MKKCSYCGRENEDVAVQCRECGTDEFDGGLPQTPAAPTIATCQLCHVTTDIKGAFGRLRMPTKTLMLCPICWHRQRNKMNQWLLILQLGFGPLGIFLLCWLPENGCGWVVLNLFIFHLATILSLVPHEFCHALAARCVGWRVFKIFIGSGKVMAKTVLLGFETEFRAIPLGGLTLVAPRHPGHYRAKRFAITAAGPLANAFLAGACFAFMAGSFHGFSFIAQRPLPVEMLFIANLFITFQNLLPHKITTALGETSSDGMGLLQAIRSNPDRAKESHVARFLLEAAVCMERKQFAAAQSWREQGLQQYPDNLQLQISVGAALIHAQQYDDARDWFLKILPGPEKNRLLHCLTLNNLAYIAALLGRPELLPEADRYSLEALKGLSWMAAIKGTRGSVLLALDRPGEAAPFLRDAMQQCDDPNAKAESACWLAIAETRLGNMETGRDYLEQARKLDSACCLLEYAQKAMATATTESDH